jgi:hypothetical protein
MLNIPSKDSTSLDLFKRQFLQLVPIRDLQWPQPAVLKEITAQRWLYTHLFDSNNVKYSPPERYQLQVLEQLLKTIEEAISDPDEDVGKPSVEILPPFEIWHMLRSLILSIQEISDELTSKLTDILSTPTPDEYTSAQRRSYVTYSFPDLRNVEPCSITLLESRSIISSSRTTGLRTWEATLHLSRFLCNPEGSQFVQGKRVLELGAGTGLVSLLCAKYLAAEKVIATDGSQEVVAALEENIFLNGLDTIPKIQSRMFRWGMAPDDMEVDIVIGADIVSHFPKLTSIDWMENSLDLRFFSLSIPPINLQISLSLELEFNYSNIRHHTQWRNLF